MMFKLFFTLSLFYHDSLQEVTPDTDPNCAYSCQTGGGCSVTYTGPPRSGPTSGSCFSQTFGGSCSGTPPECQNCNQAVDCEEKKIIISKPDSNLTASDLNPEECLYSCQPGGGCLVQYRGPPRGGPTLGSCFPPSFGGSCTGTPPECADCSLAVECPEGGLEVGPGEEEATGDVCDYKCQDNGGCEVLYTGPPRGGNTFGSCFPALFGGTCSGTPAECEDCNQVVQCEEEGPDYESYDQEEGEADIVPPSEDEPCVYLCNPDASCTVRYAGPPQSGSTVGNCFSPSFGGGCSGTPEGCRDCNTAVRCRRREEEEGEVAGLEEYCRISRSHTMCQFSPGTVSDRCGQVLTHRMTEQIKQRLLDHHNKLRRVVARGEQPGQPPASNMMELEWSDELSDISQTWADQCDCVFHQTNVYPCYHEHGGGRDRAGLNTSASGQNLAWQTLPLPSTRQNWTGKAQGWFDEVYDFNATVVEAWEPSEDFVIGHYTQFVWAESYKVGCGILISKAEEYKFQYLVCNYFPPGNHLGAPVYLTGPACSSCPPGTRCSQGLCQRVKK